MYKAWSNKLNKFIYGDLEIKINNNSKDYYIVIDDYKEKVDEWTICSKTRLFAGKDKIPIYEHDIIVIHAANETLSLIVKRGVTIIDDVYIDGLFFEKINSDLHFDNEKNVNKHVLCSNALLLNYNISIIGNEVELKITNKNKKEI